MVIEGTMDRLGFLLRDSDTTPGRATNAALYVLNALFIGLYILSTYPLAEPYHTLIRGGEVTLATVFLGEYVVRVYSADDRLAEITDPYTVVDLLAILPVFLLPGPDVGFLRGLHTLRVFRFLRLLVDERQVIGRSVRVRTVRRIELSVTIFLIFFIATGFIYAAEHGINPDIETFGDAFYYAVIAISTVGFGDITPVTVAGRWVTVTAVLVGFVLLPWQAARLRDLPTRDANCPRCNADVGSDHQFCWQCGETLPE